ncbi:MAG TPA: peptide ABC transporter substrate-binding protein [Anaerolineales bacterium]|nr:peptide ABC transporter substrate-binding protein [Anaerolineales bacterium]
MKRSQYSIIRFVLVAGLLSACSAAVTPTPPPTPPPHPSTPTPLPQPPTASGWPTPPESFLPRPTATLPEASTVAENGVYTNAQYGVTVHYPADWTTEAITDDSQGGLAWFYGSGSLTAILFFTTWGNQPLASAAQQINDSSLSNLKDMEVVSDGLIKLDGGAEAWATVITAKFDDGTPLKAGITTIIGGSNTYSIMVYGSPRSYDEYQDDIAGLTASMQYTGRSLYGIPRSQALVLAGGESTNPRDYDPATSHGGSGDMVFTGLVSFDPQLNLVPELAESWTVTDGAVYTFTLRSNARFHNGRPVTAQDVIYSWERAADPATESDTVLTYLGDIVGVNEMHEGKADHISGLQSIDDHTLQVTIDAPKPYFLMKLTFPTAFVLDKYNVEPRSEWYRTPNGTGPYRLIRWDTFELMLYERNEDYYLGPPAIPYVIVQLFTGDDVRLYESGESDLAYVGRYDVPRFQDPNEPLHADLRTGVNLCTGYISFDVTQPPFDDVKVRQAFAMAFDREKYIDVVLNGIGLPAHGLYPPGLPGYNVDLQGLSYDPERARQSLAESKYGGPENLPPIVFTSAGAGSDVSGSVAALAQMWQQTLGVTISIENLEPDKYYDELYAGRHGQITSGGWCADYPDPENFADALFHTGAPENRSNYSNPELDALLEQARVETDVAKRILMYQEAEQIIVNDAPALFTTHSLSFVLIKPHIQGFVLTPISVPTTRYLWIDASKLK